MVEENDWINDAIVEHYKKNPPKVVLDDQGVRHWQEVELPAKYGDGFCTCGFHPIESDSWYHKPMKITAAGSIAVYRACRKCGEFLIRDLSQETAINKEDTDGSGKA
jgi:hypothetical protein